MDNALERLVWTRANSCCEYCHMPSSLAPAPFQIDHIVARKHEGKTVQNNLALACFDCNSYKGPNIAGFDPLRGRLSRLFNPRRDRWEKHFEWSGAVLVGLTAVGRTTIQVLWINHPESIEVRQLWIEAGEFRVSAQ